jgi:hypothetical protein
MTPTRSLVIASLGEGDPEEPNTKETSMSLHSSTLTFAVSAVIFGLSSAGCSSAARHVPCGQVNSDANLPLRTAVKWLKDQRESAVLGVETLQADGHTEALVLTKGSALDLISSDASRKRVEEERKKFPFGPLLVPDAEERQEAARKGDPRGESDMVYLLTRTRGELNDRSTHAVLGYCMASPHTTGFLYRWCGDLVLKDGGRTVTAVICRQGQGDLQFSIYDVDLARGFSRHKPEYEYDAWQDWPRSRGPKYRKTMSLPRDFGSCAVLRLRASPVKGGLLLTLEADNSIRHCDEAVFFYDEAENTLYGARVGRLEKITVDPGNRN